MKRIDVYKEIDEERDYQDSLDWHSIKQDEEHSVADWLIFMEKKVNQAKAEIYELKEKEALRQIKKVVALGVACLEHKLNTSGSEKE